MRKLNLLAKFQELESYVEEWYETVNDRGASGSLFWQPVFLPAFVDAGIAVDSDGETYLVTMAKGGNPLAMHVAEDTAIKLLSRHLEKSSASQVDMYHAWASAVLNRKG